MCANVTWAMHFCILCRFSLLLLLLFLFHSLKLAKDREIKGKIASKRLAKFSSTQHTAKNCETLQPSDTKGTKEMHRLTATPLELKFTALNPAFQLSQHLYQAAVKRQEGKPQPSLGEQLLGRKKKISPARQKKSWLPDNSMKALLLFLEPA